MTADFDVLIQRSDLRSVISIANENGFSGPGDRLRHATFSATVHLHFTGERSNDSQAMPNPEISPTRITLHGLDVPVMPLHELVLTRLNSERTIDRVSIRSMDAAGLITADVESALPEKLRSRLQNPRYRMSDSAWPFPVDSTRRMPSDNVIFSVMVSPPGHLVLRSGGTLRWTYGSFIEVQRARG